MLLARGTSRQSAPKESKLDEQQWADAIGYLAWTVGQAVSLRRHKPEVSNAIVANVWHFYAGTAKRPVS